MDTNLKYWGNNEPLCPYCDYSIEISQHEYYFLYEFEGEHKTTCPNCENEIIIVTNIKYTFSTDNQEEQ